jgi:hypothetical protein
LYASPHDVTITKIKDKISAREPEDKRLLMRCKHNWKVDIRLEIRENVLEGVAGMIHNRRQWRAFVNATMNIER